MLVKICEWDDHTLTIASSRDLEQTLELFTKLCYQGIDRVDRATHNGSSNLNHHQLKLRDLVILNVLGGQAMHFDHPGDRGNWRTRRESEIFINCGRELTEAPIQRECK